MKQLERFNDLDILAFLDHLFFTFPIKNYNNPEKIILETDFIVIQVKALGFGLHRNQVIDVIDCINPLAGGIKLWNILFLRDDGTPWLTEDQKKKVLCTVALSIVDSLGFAQSFEHETMLSFLKEYSEKSSLDYGDVIMLYGILRGTICLS